MIDLGELALWKTAMDKSSDPTAFIELTDKFVYSNQAWCRMLGYAEIELKTKRWQDITSLDDVGGDQAENESIRNGEKDEYYIEKTCIRKDGSEVEIGQYVHRYPAVGPQQGYVVFAKILMGNSDEYKELREKFMELERMITMFQHNESNTEILAKMIESQGKEIEENRDLLKSLIQKGDIVVNQPTGDQITGNHNSTNRISNDTKFIVAVMGFFCTVFISIVAGLAYISYINEGNPELTPPDIKQPVLNMSGDEE